MSRYIDEHRGRFGVEPICRTLDVSASAYYHRASGARSARVVEDELLLQCIGEVHAANYFAYGYRRTWKALLRAGEDVGRDRVKRHRHEARFYLVSPSSTERCLAQNEADRLTPQLQSTLGTSRAKHLALEQVDDPPAGDGVRRRLARRVALEANITRMQLDRARAQGELTEASDRFGRMEEERAGLHAWQRRQRAELDGRHRGFPGCRRALGRRSSRPPALMTPPVTSSTHLAKRMYPETPNSTRRPPWRLPVGGAANRIRTV